MQRFSETSPIRSITLDAPTECLTCRVHFDTAASHYSTETEFPWSVLLHCGNCSEQWYVCKYCSSQRCHLVSREQVRKHDYYKHRAKKKPRIRNIQETGDIVQKCDDNVIIQEDIVGFSSSDKNVFIGGHKITEDIPTSQKEDSLSTSEKRNDCAMPTMQLDDFVENSLITEYSEHDGGSRFVVQAISSASRNFFSYERKSLGKASLVAKSYFNGLGEIANEIPQENVDFYLQYAKLSRMLGSNARQELLKLMDMYNSHMSVVEHKSCIPWTIKQIPKKESEVRSYFTEGKNAIYTNYPCPSISSTSCGHAYTLLTDVLVHYFELGGMLSQVDRIGKDEPKKHFFHSKVVQNCVFGMDGFLQYQPDTDDQGKIHRLILCEWSDDFEPNYGSMNKGSVYMKTVSIIQNPGMNDSMVFTFPLILGPKNADHNAVETLVMRDIKELQTNSHRNLFYSSYLQSDIHVSPEIVISLLDQPARRSFTSIAGGNGAYSARWGYACNWLEVQDYLPMCDQCLMFMEMSNEKDNYATWQPRLCSNCSCWALDINHILLQHQTPDDYPESQRYLKPRILNFDELRDVVGKTHTNIVNGKWTNRVAEVYLKTWALSNKTITEILEHADNCWQLISINDDDVNEGYRQAILQDQTDHPEQYKMWDPPPSWNRKSGTKSFSNAIMHLMSGISKTTIMTCLSWITKKYNARIMESRGQKMMKSVADLCLGWCRLPPKFGGKFVGSLSENNISLGRISLWIFSSLPPIQDTPAFEEPSVQQSKWLKKHNVSWLKARGLKTDGNASEVKDRVEKYMAQRIIPPLLSEQCGDSIIVNRVVHSLHCVLSCVFRSETTYQSIVEAEIKIRLFLQYFSILDKEVSSSTNDQKENDTPENNLQEEECEANNSDNRMSEREPEVDIAEKSKLKSRIPKWISSYNFLSLLNIPDEMRRYGPPRGHYEGSYKGEKIVATMKPLIGKGLHGNWAYNALKTNWVNYITKALDEGYQGKASDSDDKKGDMISTSYGKMITIYDGLPTIQSSIAQKLPISGCYCDDGVYHVVISCGKQSSSCKTIRIRIAEAVVEYCGMKYQKLAIDLDLDGALCNLSMLKIADYCLFLPLIADAPVIPQNQNSGYYAILTHEWTDTHVATSVESYR